MFIYYVEIYGFNFRNNMFVKEKSKNNFKWKEKEWFNNKYVWNVLYLVLFNIFFLWFLYEILVF